VTVALIAAVAANGVIGRKGRLPWHLPADLKRFQQLTTGHHLVIGRSTWESIGKPLPDRTFVVVTRTRGAPRPGLSFATSVEAGLRLAHAAGDALPFVAGGTGIFREALERDLVDRLYLTRIGRDYEGETHFPELDASRWRLVEREPHAATREPERPPFEFQVLERLRP
jgi:dihydrofolate reductase